MKLKAFLQTRRAGHAGFSTALVALVLALFYLLNLTVLGLCEHFGWYLYTVEQYDFSLGTASEKLLSDIDTENGRVKIVFCDTESNIASHRQLDYVYETVTALAARHPDLLEVAYVNRWLEPDKLAGYRTGEDGEENILDSATVIFDYRGEYVLRTASDFYMLDTDNYVTGYIGEETAVSSILWVTERTHPVAYLTSNHGEEVPVGLALALMRAGYTVSSIDLASVAAIPEDAGLVVISSPVYDFQKTAVGSVYVSELTKLENYLAGGGNMLVSLNPAHMAGQPRLADFLATYGITAAGGTVYDGTAALPGSNGLSLFASYTDSPAATALSAAAGVGGHRTVLSYATPLAAADTVKATAMLLMTSAQTAEVRAADGTVTSQGVAGLAARAEMKTGGGALVVLGSPFFADTDLLNGAGYGNRDMLHAALLSLGAPYAPVGVGFLPIDRTAIENLTAQEADLFALAAAVAVPLALVITGAVITRRRRSR